MADIESTIRNSARRAKRAAKETEEHLDHLQKLAEQNDDQETIQNVFIAKCRARGIWRETNRILRKYNAPAGETAE